MLGVVLCVVCCVLCVGVVCCVMCRMCVESCSLRGVDVVGCVGRVDGCGRCRRRLYVVSWGAPAGHAGRKEDERRFSFALRAPGCTDHLGLRVIAQQ